VSGNSCDVVREIEGFFASRHVALEAGFLHKDAKRQEFVMLKIVNATGNPELEPDGLDIGLFKAGEITQAGLVTKDLAAESEKKDLTITLPWENNTPPESPHKYVIGCDNSFACDALFRDFTVNAVYVDVFSRTIVDPLGTGLEDLLNGIARPCNPDNEEMLKKDQGGRLRLFKMLLKGFQVNKENSACLPAMWWNCSECRKKRSRTCWITRPPRQTILCQA
jgi:hypothetical protein